MEVMNKKSPYYKGSLLWNNLTKEEQESDSVLLFKNVIQKQYNSYVKDFYV